MKLDQDLIASLRVLLGSIPDVVEKAIVGGTGFIVRGRLICGVVSMGLLVRVADTTQPGFLGDDGASPMVMGGRSSGGWLVVPGANLGHAPVLDKWVARAVESAPSDGPE